jgi:hypothetical protein
MSKHTEGLLRDRSGNAKLEPFRKIAETNGGTLLTNVYLGFGDPLCFKCKNDNHPVFWLRPAVVKSGKWCKLCEPEPIILRLERLIEFAKSMNSIYEGKKECGDVLYIKFICKRGHEFEMTTHNIKNAIRNSQICKCPKCD